MLKSASCLRLHEVAGFGIGGLVVRDSAVTQNARIRWCSHHSLNVKDLSLQRQSLNDGSTECSQTGVYMERTSVSTTMLTGALQSMDFEI
jgi:hypothetical protein